MKEKPALVKRFKQNLETGKTDLHLPKKRTKPTDLVATGKLNVKFIKSRGKVYTQRWLYIPAKLIDSGKFPFEADETVVFVLDEKRQQVILQKLRTQPV